jgi:hypothetical protein
MAQVYIYIFLIVGDTQMGMFNTKIICANPELINNYKNLKKGTCYV